MTTRFRDANADVGHFGEMFASERCPQLALVPDEAVEHYDGVLLEAIVTEQYELPIAERGTPVEIKAAAYRKRDGNSVRRGDIQIRAYAHGRLLEADGEYIIVVYRGDPHAAESYDDLDWIAYRMVSARTVDRHITTWCRDGSESVARIPWSRLVPPARVERENGGEST